MQQRSMPDEGAGAPQSAPVAADDTGVVLGVDAAQYAQKLLAEHVPLTLIVDLLAPTGETSAELLEKEGLPGDAWWGPSSEGARPDA
ncbi:hypothetical protein [Cellulomonas xiejunii]|uniref:Uncharacterized protein n=1 Tax=Cellulomonas xiejunii TaxID=2968083 RepID=A0ABY5KRI3_9CELL|nr:hypothetical protein [Cellulomonas xiejunii]MCC2315744.1 hypothetical protein [Cellulomonas xiejunii]MCC2321808.1 hypothetical protein [Cellulomonas xiejunii]UUI73112.1 hypothetical protein NP048_06650 [Cellulomonas xiejunii]